MKNHLIGILLILFSSFTVYLAIPKESEKTVTINEVPFQGTITIHKKNQWLSTTYHTTASLKNTSEQTLHYTLYGVDEFRPYYEKKGELLKSVRYVPSNELGFNKEESVGGMIYEYILAPNEVLAHQDTFKVIHFGFLPTTLEYIFPYREQEGFSEDRKHEFRLILE